MISIETKGVRLNTVEIGYCLSPFQNSYCKTNKIFEICVKNFETMNQVFAMISSSRCKFDLLFANFSKQVCS